MLVFESLSRLIYLGMTFSLLYSIVLRSAGSVRMDVTTLLLKSLYTVVNC